MGTPSSNWQEHIPPDEEAGFQARVERFRAAQESRSIRYGKGRALHRKQILGAPATFEVLADIPAHASQGVFAKPATHEAWVRLSNGGMDVQPDRKPDVRGLAIKVHGIQGPGALGSDTQSQDFLLINHESFLFPNGEEFVDLVLAAGEKPGNLFKYLRKRYGVLGAIGVMHRLARTASKPFAGFAMEEMYSAVPFACGPYAARARLLPPLQAPGSARPVDLCAEFLSHLDRGPLTYEFQLQFFVDEIRTPIEDASIPWREADAPYYTVARLHVPRASEWTDQRDELQQAIEHAVFDPWCALSEHRPLGSVMRARRFFYFESQKSRGAVSG